METPPLPHILSGGVAKMDIGRRRRSYTGANVPLPWYTLYILESGDMNLSIDGEKPIHFEAPAALILSPGKQYIFKTPVISEITWIDWGFAPSKLVSRKEGGNTYRYADDKHQPELNTSFNVDIPIKLDTDLYAQSARICLQINGMWWRGAKEWLRANLLLGEWLLDTIAYYKGNREQSSHRFPGLDEVTQKLVTLAEHHIEQRFNVTRWAQLAGLNRNTLNQRIQRELGMNAKEVLDTIRFDRSCESLRANAAILDAARYAGFQSRTTFSRWFKSRSGLNPSEWRITNSR